MSDAYPFHAAPQRPSPEEMLVRANRSESRGDSSGTSVAYPAYRRGRLKIFFGMAPGVGKTYAMLAAAQRMAAQGIDVVVGVVETHGRAETEQLLLGLDILPRRQVEYRGPDGTASPVILSEFDVEAAIARRPDILLVDELAHTNAPGNAREKRWQDVQECLKAGISVYSTINVQHIESLNDLVTQITGVAVRETVPDWVIDESDEIELVDTPPEVLHERLKAGKVYLAENAARAVDPSDGFFRKGNLTALRELALRRTASWVDSEMQRYKADRGIRTAWPAGERILVAVSPSPMSGKLVRAAKRMAAGLHADLIAVYVETPRTAQLHTADRERLMQTLRLAESLGATTATLTGANAAQELIAFARSRDVSRIVVGKTGQARWRELLLGSFVSELIRQSGEIDVYVIRGESAEFAGNDAAPAQAARYALPLRQSLVRIGLALLLVATETAIGSFAFARLDIANIVMIYVAGVVVAAVWLGRVPSIVATVVGVAAFDFFFVPPRLTFAVSDVQYLVTFAVMLAVGLLISHLTTRLHELVAASSARERRTGALYALSRELSAAQNAHDAAAVGARHLHDTLGCDVVVSLPVQKPAEAAATLDTSAFAGSPDWFDDRERAVAQWAIDNGKTAGLGTQRLPGATAHHVPLTGSGGRLGALSLRPRASAHLLETTNLLLLETFASQIASAIERVNLIHTQQATRLEAERERLRSALLSSVSHDLRTPLASITGAASVLEESGTSLDEHARSSLLRTIVSESARLGDLIANLVFATRLEAGGITLNRDWTTVEEIIGVGLSRHRIELARRPFKVNVAAGLPMIRVDSAMLPQVVHNLIENALRYTPEGTPMSVSAWNTESHVVIRVADEGLGLSEEETARVFQRFYRGRAARANHSGGTATGMGLGLTICEGIVKVHGGRIWAESNSPRGVAFLFSVPVEYPQPTLPREIDTTAEAEGNRG